MPAASSLTVVGTGIKFLSQMTLETKAYIEESDKVLYLVNDPVLKQWIIKTNKNTESLDPIYFAHAKRIDSYQAITDYILAQLSTGFHICVALYGHPAVFAKPALDAVIEAKKRGYNAKVLSGISAEDCLFADLLIDPGYCGSQSFEATDFLLYDRKFDVNSNLILWQPDVIGEQGHHITQGNNGLALLQEHLLKYYSSEHQVVIYEAAQYPGLQPIIKRISLEFLSQAMLSPACTLYIKPAGKSPCNIEYAKRLNLNLI